jgi:hypothetical protein
LTDLVDSDKLTASQDVLDAFEDELARKNEQRKAKKEKKSRRKEDRKAKEAEDECVKKGWY